MITEWQRRRAALNHDWLKNRFLTMLNSGLNLLDSRTEDPQLEYTLVEKVASGWKGHKQEVWQLIEEFESEMSPRQLWPPGEGYHVFSEFSHALWLHRYPVKKWLARARAALDAADAAFREWETALNGCEDIHSIGSLRPYREPFARFRDRCQELAKAIEKFPDRILVT